MVRAVLVTGAAQYPGGRLARLLAADPAVERVVGVDVVPPPDDLAPAEFVRIDIRNPGLGRVLDEHRVDTVVHAGVVAAPLAAGGRSVMKELNVIGTMQLLAACQRQPGLRRLVVKSSTAVYGASPGDPALFTEDTEPRSAPRGGFAKDAVDVEGYVRGFARRCPHVDVVTLRFANVMGPGVETALTRYFSMPVVPTVLGFDARLQFVHEDDLLQALRVAVRAPVTGTFNVAGDGVLTASQAIRRAGHVALPVPSPVTGPIGRAVRQAGLADFTPEQIAFLTHGRAVDTSRARTVLGFRPAYSTAGAFDTFLAARGAAARPPGMPRAGTPAANPVQAAGRWLRARLGAG